MPSSSSSGRGAAWVWAQFLLMAVILALGAIPPVWPDWLRFAGLALVLAGIGVGIGLIGAFAVTRLMSSLLFEVSAVDPLTYAVVSLTLFGATVLACYVPALRATRVDPIGALRAE